ncbi:autophagy-related protein 2 [Tanacetum coccineum]
MGNNWYQIQVSIGLAPVEDIKGSIQSKLPGSWRDLKLKVCNFELLTVSNTGGRPGANFLWVSHGEGDLWGSTIGDSNKEFILIRCDNSSRRRRNSKGSNMMSSRFPGSDIIHMWDPDNFMSQASTKINQVDDAFSGKEDLRNDKSCGSSFVLNLIDIGLSYEPYLSNLVAQEDHSREECVAGLLTASSFILSNVKIQIVIHQYNKIHLYKFKWTEKTIPVAEEWQRFATLVKQSQELKTVSYHKLYDILKQHHNEVNEIRAERIARTTNPLALVAQQQPVYHPQNHPNHYTHNSSTRSQQAATRNREKAIVNSPPPTYDQEPEMVAKDDALSKKKEIDKLMDLISLSFNKIYKPTNNNLRTLSNTSRAN